MRHPYEKFMKMELFAIIGAIIVGIIALIKGFVLVVILALYMVSFSMFSGAIVEWNTRQTQQAGKHLLQAAMLFIFTTYMIFHL
ncbi:hypothetical protein ABRT01_09265 [Lentibacillus sp. L22]|uniref:hypothetical protein n=1 Tax=Lentibacillus TaxID=175304 RepID=UPI0022B19CC8|nr:hypothetical protein [Lentibacillus daqui]